MKRRQPVPRQWLVADRRMGEQLWAAVRRLPRGSGVLVLYRDMPDRERLRLIANLTSVARSRGLVVADEAAGEAARVHDMRELRRAGSRQTQLIFLSPIYPTRSHPDWAALPRMRAATLARLAKAPIIALGGMTARRFARVRDLGFHGWAGIGAFRT